MAYLHTDVNLLEFKNKFKPESLQRIARQCQPRPLTVLAVHAFVAHTSAAELGGNCVLENFGILNNAIRDAASKLDNVVFTGTGVGEACGAEAEPNGAYKSLSSAKYMTDRIHVNNLG